MRTKFLAFAALTLALGNPSARSSAADGWQLGRADHITAYRERGGIRISATVSFPTPCYEGKLQQLPSTDPKSPKTFGVLVRVKPSATSKLCPDVVVEKKISQDFSLTPAPSKITVRSAGKTETVTVIWPDKLSAAGSSTDTLLVVHLYRRSGSTIDGQAVFTPLMHSGSTPSLRVTITLDGVFIPEDRYPAGIYVGSCRDTVSGAPVYRLNPVQGGKSVTTIQGAAMLTLENPMHSIVVTDHRPTFIGRVVSCGAITPR